MNLKNNFMKNKLVLLLVLVLTLTACGGAGANNESVNNNAVSETPATEMAAELPAPLLDENADAPYALENSSITVENLDQFMNRDDVLYIDIRDYNDYAAKHFKNFEVIPFFGYIFNPDANTNPEMIQLYGGSPEEPVDVYEESDTILNALFPKDKTLFIMCEKGGRVTQLLQILDSKGYDMSKIYNIGGMGQYTDPKYKEYITDAYELTLEANYGFDGLNRK